MPVSDLYTARTATGGVSLTPSSVTYFLSVNGTATKRGWVTGVRVGVGATLAAAGNTALFQLARPNNTPATPTSPVSGNAHDFRAPASILQTCTAWTTPPTLGVVVWEQMLPYTTGSAWEEFPPSGDEWLIPDIAAGSANCGLHMFITVSVATAGLFEANIIWSE